MGNFCMKIEAKINQQKLKIFLEVKHFYEFQYHIEFSNSLKNRVGSSEFSH